MVRIRDEAMGPSEYATPISRWLAHGERSLGMLELMDENPYRSVVSDAASEQRIRSRWRFLGWLVIFTYPMLLVAAFYAAWCAAWLTLGRPPRPLLDDPKSLGPISYGIIYIPGVLVAIWPACVVIGLVSAYYCPRGIRHSRILLVFTYLMLCGFAWMLLRTDPWGVVEWWFD